MQKHSNIKNPFTGIYNYLIQLPSGIVVIFLRRVYARMRDAPRSMTPVCTAGPALGIMKMINNGWLYPTL